MIVNLFNKRLFVGDKDKDKKEPELTETQKKKLDIEETKKSLPIYPFRDDIIQAVRDHQVLIIEGETGSGKTTQIPQYLHEAGFTADGTIFLLLTHNLIYKIQTFLIVFDLP